MKKGEACSECPLGKPIKTKDGDLITLGKSFSVTEGKPRFGVYLVGEALGNNEAQEGGVFRPNGESGSLITSIIEKQLTILDPEINQSRKMKRDDFSWDNIVKCQPPNNELQGKSYEKDAIEACRTYSSRSFGNPIWNNANGYNKVIVALGAVAFRELTGVSGKKQGIEDVRGYVFRSIGYNGLVIGSLHPSFIRHGNARFTNSLIYDLRKALLVANGSYISYRDHPDFIGPEFVKTGKLQALVSLFYQLKENPGLTLYYDIENPYTKFEEEEDKGDLENEEGEDKDNGDKSDYAITSIQFSTDSKWAINVPWQKPFIKVALAILALSNDKVGANVWHHDNPRLEANGAKIGGVIHDLMWAWKHQQPGLWKGLQRIGSFFDVPYNWKHLALTGNEQDDDEYGCMDVIAPAIIWPKLVAKMKKIGVWESYLRFKVDYRTKVLRPAEIRGMPVDLQEHQEFEKWVKEEVSLEDKFLQAGIPQELRNISPARKDKVTGEKSYGYIKEPREIQQLRAGYNVTRDRLLSRGVQLDSIIKFGKWVGTKTDLTLKQFDTVSNNGNSEFEYITRWCRIEPFKASSQQLVKYLKWRIAKDELEGKVSKYYVPQALRTKRDTTGKKELQEVWEKTGDELLGSVIRIRSYNKMLSNDIPNWLPDKDGVVRTTFKFDPPSWQLNSFRPNIQNASKHPKEWELIGKTASELQLIGQRFRKIVKAPPGRCVVEFDKKGFHVAMMGFEARDPLYLKWANHLHTVFASYIVNEAIDIQGEIDLDKISYIKKKYKNIRDGQAKPTVLGNQLGLGAYKLCYMNRSYIDELGKRQPGIESIRRAKYLQEFLAHLFPKVETYKTKIKEEAHFKSYLMSNFGAVRWFYDVLRWDYKSRKMKNGSEAEEAQSHKLQANAFGMIHSEALDMADSSEILEEHWLANSIHDSFIFFPETSKVERCIAEVVNYMTKPEKMLSDQLLCPNGLVIGVDVMASPDGGNWANYHPERNPMGIREVKI